ncbi:MAG TPA: arsenate reductase family protein [Opitutales bacterium]|nr:arsenate reductase family protein [Opitutales bacterium]
MLKIYTYKNCGTCRKAKKFLDAKGIAYKEHPIRETPPPPDELSRMLEACDGKMSRLFNSSSQDYRAAGLKDLLPTLSRDEAFALLQQNGNLVKRPFLIGDDVALVGFREAEWNACKGPVLTCSVGRIDPPSVRGERIRTLSSARFRPAGSLS